MTKTGKPNYLAKVKKLPKEETERLLSRMGNKLDRRLEKGKLSQQQALAKQLELEDEQLQAWRKVMRSLKEKEEAKKAKEEAKVAKKEGKSASKTKATAKQGSSKAKGSRRWELLLPEWPTKLEIRLQPLISMPKCFSANWLSISLSSRCSMI